MLKRFLFIIAITLIIAMLAQQARAEYAVPSFPACQTQTGTGDLAHYIDGKHQIAGGDLVDGKDDVYSLGNGNALQCYCPDVSDQTGIQTNWLNVTNLSNEDKTKLQQQGWILESNGSDWGLENAPYLAQNSNYSCHTPQATPTPTVCEKQTLTPTEIPSVTPTDTPPAITQTPTNGPTATPTDAPAPTATPTPITVVVQAATATNTSSGSNTNTSSSSSSAPAPTTLPSTGNSTLLLTTLGTGILSLLIRVLLKKIM